MKLDNVPQGPGPLRRPLSDYFSVGERTALALSALAFTGVLTVRYFTGSENLIAMILKFVVILILGFIPSFFRIPYHKFSSLIYSALYIGLFVADTWLTAAFPVAQAAGTEAHIFRMPQTVLPVLYAQALRPGILPGLPVLAVLAVGAFFHRFLHSMIPGIPLTPLQAGDLAGASLLILPAEWMLYYILTRYKKNRDQTVFNEQELRLSERVYENLFAKFKENDFAKLTLYKHAHHIVGGDYCDVVRMREGNIGLFLADISGHGISAAMMCAAIKDYLRDMPYSHRIAPELLLGNLDVRIHRECGFHHASAIYTYFDFEKKHAILANAGHPRAYFAKKGQEFTVVKTRGVVIGHELAEVPARSIQFDIASGDRLLLYTDGLTEYDSYTNEIPELDLNHLLSGLNDLEIEKILPEIVARTQSLPDFRGFKDDLLLALLEIK